MSDWLLQKHRTRSIGDERWVINTSSKFLSTHQTLEVLVKGLNITPAPEWAVVEQDLRSLTVLAEKVRH